MRTLDAARRRMKRDVGRQFKVVECGWRRRAEPARQNTDLAQIR